MNAHTELKFHLDRHIYKRGAYKGEAPADPSRRGKTQFRVIKGNGGQMIVRYHHADIMTAYEDGRIVLDTRGWHDSPTTRSAMNEALGFAGFGRIGSLRYRSYSQAAIRANGKTYRYYDGMEFSAEGVLLTEAKTFTAKMVDRDETAEFRADIKESGFVGMFPILYEVATPEAAGNHVWDIKKKICNEYGASSWPDIVANIKYPRTFNRNLYKPAYPDHKSALRAFLATYTKNMTKHIDTDVTVL